LRRKCRQDGKTIGSFTTYNVDIAVTRYSSSPQHQLCGKTLLKAALLRRGARRTTGRPVLSLLRPGKRPSGEEVEQMM
jgi:hypothetical protein